MGWKATKEIKRGKALWLINTRLLDLTNEELSSTLTAMGFGDNTDLRYYGYNFTIIDDESDYENDKETI